MGDRRVRTGQLTAAPGLASLFLDRDGVLNEPVWAERRASMDCPLKPAAVILSAAAAASLRRPAPAGGPGVDEFFRHKVRRHLGWPGARELTLANPARLPVGWRTNLYVEATIASPATYRAPAAR